MKRTRPCRDGPPRGRAPRRRRWRRSRRSRSRPGWPSPARSSAAAAPGRHPAPTVSYRTTAALPRATRRQLRGQLPAQTGHRRARRPARRSPLWPRPRRLAPLRQPASWPMTRRPRRRPSAPVESLTAAATVEVATYRCRDRPPGRDLAAITTCLTGDAALAWPATVAAQAVPAEARCSTTLPADPVPEVAEAGPTEATSRASRSLAVTAGASSPVVAGRGRSPRSGGGPAMNSRRRDQALETSR